MAKPIVVQKLKHGKALCGKTFGGFVDTFNWLVDFCQALKGDKDTNIANGTITVDRADPSAPVIRGGGGGGGGAVDGGWHAPGCWEIAAELVEGEAGQPAQTVARWTNQYIMLGAEMLSADVSDDPTTHAGKFVAVQITDGASGAGAVSIQEYATAAAMAAATNDATKYTIPLGKLNSEGTGYEIDMRFIPHAGAWDAYIAPDDSGDDDSPSGGNGGAS